MGVQTSKVAIGSNFRRKQNKSLIPRDELVGASAILIMCYYKNQEFIRIGYFVSIDFIDDDEANRFDNDKNYVPDEELLARHILADKAIVTRFPVDFESEIQI